MHNSAYLERPDPTLCRVKGYARLHYAGSKATPDYCTVLVGYRWRKSGHRWRKSTHRWRNTGTPNAFTQLLHSCHAHIMIRTLRAIFPLACKKKKKKKSGRGSGMPPYQTLPSARREKRRGTRLASNPIPVVCRCGHHLLPT